MGNLIFYGLCAIAALSFIAAANKVIGDHYTKPLEEHQKIVVAAKDAEIKAGQDANNACRASNGALEQHINSLSAAATAVEQESTKRTSAAKANAEAMIRSQEPSRAAIARERERAATPTKGDACAEARTTLSDLARDMRVRNPGTAETVPH